MGTIATVRVNTTQKMILYRDFVVQEVWATGGDVWEWAHENFGGGDVLGHDAYGQCQTVFECIDAIDEWHTEREFSS